MISRGGGFLIFGIPILFVKYDPLKLLGQPADLVVVFCVPQTLQTNMKRLLGRKRGGAARQPALRFIRHRAGLLCLCPPRLHSFACALHQLFLRKFGSSCTTALRRAQAAECNGRRILSTSHDLIIRARARKITCPGKYRRDAALAAARTCIRTRVRNESESGCPGPTRSSAVIAAHRRRRRDP